MGIFIQQFLHAGSHKRVGNINKVVLLKGSRPVITDSVQLLRRVRYCMIIKSTRGLVMADFRYMLSVLPEGVLGLRDGSSEWEA